MPAIRAADSSSCPRALLAYIKRLQRKIPLAFVLLFGSRARGSPHKYSDHDIFVVAEKLPEDYWQRLELLSQNKPVGVDIVAFSTEEVNRLLHRGLILDALLDGQLLLGDGQIYAQLKRKAEEYLREKGLVKTEWGYFKKWEEAL